jgi:hypothetical protein
MCWGTNFVETPTRQKKTTTSSSTQKMSSFVLFIGGLFLPFWIQNRIWIPNLDPLTKLNPDPLR